MKRTLLAGSLAALVAATVASTGVLAQDPATSTLQQVIDRGRLIVATDTSIPPIASRDENGVAVGFDPDVAAAVARELGVELEIIDTTAADRIPNLTTNRVDVVIANFTRTNERSKSIGFTDPYIVAGYVLAVKADSGITGLADLSGKTVAGVRNGIAEPVLNEQNPEVNVALYDTAAAALLAVKQGQADAILEDSNYLVYQSGLDPTIQVLPESLVPLQYNSFGVRLGDQIWLNWLNQFLFEFNASGENAALYEKWFGLPPVFPLQPQY